MAFVEVGGYSKETALEEYLSELYYNGIVTTAQNQYPELNTPINIWSNRAVKRDSLIVLEVFTSREHNSEKTVPVVTCTSSDGEIHDLTVYSTAFGTYQGVSAVRENADIGGEHRDFVSFAFIFALTGADANVSLSIKTTELRARITYTASVVQLPTT